MHAVWDMLVDCCHSSCPSQEGLPGNLADRKGTGHTVTGGEHCGQSATSVGLKRKDRGLSATCHLAAQPSLA